MIKIVVDSTADIPPDIRATYNIFVVPLLVQFGGETLRDDIDISRDQFYARLVASAEVPKTAAPSVGTYEALYRELTADGSEVLSISIASSLSATFGASVQGARLVDSARIACVDSQSVAMPLTYMAMAAARAAQQGRSLSELVALVEAMRPRTIIYVALDSLYHLEKGGRIGRTRAFLGTMLNVKPILVVRHAEVQPVEQVRTWKRVLLRMVELARTHGVFEDLSVLYTTTPQGAEQLADMCAESGLMRRDRIRVVQAGATLGTHVGPGALGITGLLQG